MFGLQQVVFVFRQGPVASPERRSGGNRHADSLRPEYQVNGEAKCER